MKPTNIELEHRLEQIRQAGVPYHIFINDQRPDSVNIKDVVGYFGENRIPEFVSDYDKNKAMVSVLIPPKSSSALGPEEYDKKIEAISERLSNTLPGISPSRFIDEFTGFRCLFSKNIEVHYIYDPKTDFTHIFLLPSRKLLEEANPSETEETGI